MCAMFEMREQQKAALRSLFLLVSGYRRLLAGGILHFLTSGGERLAEKKLSKNQLEAIELLITKYRISENGMNLEEIATAVGVKRQTLYNWMHKDEMFIEEYDRRVKERVRYSTGAAAHKMFQLMSCGNRKVEQAAAKDILDRGGVKSADEINVSGDPLKVRIVDDMGG